KPSRELLEQILTALKIEIGTRNRILTGAGFVVAATLFPPEVSPDYFYTIEQAAEEIELSPWPACVVNDMMDVVAANRLAQTLWNIDFDRDLTGHGERNFLSVASDPRFAGKVSNWDEAVGFAVAVLKAHGLEEPEESDGYFASVMRHFLEGDPRYVARFLNVWQNTEAHDPKCRWYYPVVWEEPELGRLQFRVVVSTASEPDGLAFNDWMPLDAPTWEALERLKRDGRRR
ncbi:MAG: hypothetical protein ACE5FA_09660, partial [Dehalococcoidia bacterium]